MKKVLIVESPSKIKTIKKFLDSDFKIVSTLGHIKDLPTNKLGVTMEGDAIDIEYVTIPGKEKVIADICKACVGADEVYLAPDPDREGEIIAWHVSNEIKKVVKNPRAIHRMTFNEITKAAILAALKKVSDVDMNKVNAQQARRVLDRWVGYEVSPVLWKKLAPGLSAGRVQSVALRLVCDREQEIRDFKSEEYWTITGLFAQDSSKKFEAELTHIGKAKVDIKDQKTAESVVKTIKDTDFNVESITDKKRLRNPVAPFMTSTLQQAAFNQLGFPVKKTMQLAQKLYEGIELEDSNPIALITYMRTDSKRVAESAITDARSYIKKNYDTDYLPSSPNYYAKEADKGQDALLASPVMPNSMKQLLEGLGQTTPHHENTLAYLTNNRWTNTFVVRPMDQLFKKYEPQPETTTPATPAPEASNTITIDDVIKVELVVGTIEQCETISGSDKLLKLSVNFGSLGQRTILSGIRKYYSPEELIGKQGVFVFNLKPRAMMGMESHGMLLCAKHGDKLTITTVAAQVPNGTKLS